VNYEGVGATILDPKRRLRRVRGINHDIFTGEGRISVEKSADHSHLREEKLTKKKWLRKCSQGREESQNSNGKFLRRGREVDF